MLRQSEINRPPTATMHHVTGPMQNANGPVQNVNGPVQNVNGPMQNANGPMQNVTPTDPATANVGARPRADRTRVVAVALAEAGNAVVRVERVADPDNPLVGARPEAEVVRLDAAELVDVRARVNRVAGARPRADRTSPDPAGAPVVHPIPMP